MKNILFILSLFSLAMSACSDDFFSQTVEIDPPPYTKQLSFHLNLSDQDTLAVLLLTRNYGILETVPNIEDYFVKGGTAAIYKNGQKWLTLTLPATDSAYLLSGVLPEPLQAGNTYEIRADHPDFPSVRATQVMPEDFVVDSARVKRQAISGQFGDKYDAVDVFIKDQPGVRNYYEVSISSFNYFIVQDPNTGMLDTLDSSEYPLYPDNFADPNVAFGVRGGGLISDQFFDGKDYKFQAWVYSSLGTPLVVRVRNVTKDYYDWSRSYQAKLNAEDNPLVEPVSVFNNLENGLGIFSVSKEKVLHIE